MSGDVITAVIIADEEQEYYFSFKADPDYEPLEWHIFRHYGEKLFLKQTMTWYMHNAKFDLHMLATEEILIAGKIHDTMVMERLLESDAMSLSLANTAKKYGLYKSEAVMEWLEENNAYEKRQVPGKKKVDKHYFWDRVPVNILLPYGCIDARITYQIANLQRQRMQEIVDSQVNLPNPFVNVYRNEMKLVKTVFHMEEYGIKLDVPYCEEACAYYTSKVDMLTDRYKRETGVAFVDSAKSFSAAIPDLKPEKLSEKTGDTSYEYDVLAALDHPIAKLILDIREAKKNLDFFNTFLYYKSPHDTIHASLNQAGTKTGRFSCSEPNLQQLTNSEEPAEGEEAYPVRRAFIPREGCFLLMVDYDQQEYRMMLDLCGDKYMISKILGGMDVHNATVEAVKAAADITITRPQAKGVNFAILYGAGNDKLGATLKTTHHEARKLRTAVFESLPNLSYFLNAVQNRAREVGHIKNWLGRMTHFGKPFFDTAGHIKEFYYRAPNSLIQGGCADVVKVAMNHCDDLLANTKSRLLMTVHDELIFEMKYGEEHLIEKIIAIMEGVYKPKNKLKLTVSAEWSPTSLADGRPLDIAEIRRAAHSSGLGIAKSISTNS